MAAREVPQSDDLSDDTGQQTRNKLRKHGRQWRSGEVFDSEEYDAWKYKFTDKDNKNKSVVVGSSFLNTIDEDGVKSFW